MSARSRSLLTAQAALFQQLATAVRHGLPLAEVVEALADDEEWPQRSRPLLRRMAQQQATGAALAKAMAGEPGLFAAETARLVAAAEALGPAQLGDVLARLAADARRRATTANDIAVTMTWPLTLCIFLMGMLATCAVYVRPAILEAYDAMRASPELPFLASTVLGTWWAWLPPVYLLLLLWYADWLPAPLRRLLELASDGFPFVRRWRSAWATTRLLDWLPLCDAEPALRQPIVACLGATARSAPSREVLRRLHAALESPVPLLDALAAEKALPPRMALLARLGARSATLSAVWQDLRHDAEQAEALAFARFDRGCVLLFYALIGYLVAMLLIGVYVPIFKIGTLL
jgi:type IV pilus assembly protein PilC